MGDGVGCSVGVAVGRGVGEGSAVGMGVGFNDGAEVVAGVSEGWEHDASGNARSTRAAQNANSLLTVFFKAFLPFAARLAK